MLRAIVLALGTVLATLPVAYSAECPVGERVTIRTLLNIDPYLRDNGWTIDGVDAQPCSVSRINGKGPVPANCKEGRLMTVTGTVQQLLGPTLFADSASCS